MSSTGPKTPRAIGNSSPRPNLNLSLVGLTNAWYPHRNAPRFVPKNMMFAWLIHPNPQMRYVSAQLSTRVWTRYFFGFSKLPREEIQNTHLVVPRITFCPYSGVGRFSDIGIIRQLCSNTLGVTRGRTFSMLQHNLPLELLGFASPNKFYHLLASSHYHNSHARCTMHCAKY